MPVREPVREAVVGLAPLLEPTAVMVVGASDKPGKLGTAMAESLRSFPGELLLVNPRPSPGTVPSIAAAGAEAAIDLAVLCVPAAATAEALRDCAAAGVRAALVCAGGFAEAGGEGVRHAAAVAEVVEETGLRVLGPNTSGFFVPGRGLIASFVPGARGLTPGAVAVVAASGGINHVLAFHLEQDGAGVSIGVGIGAGADIAAPDVLRHLVADEETRSVILHVEAVPDGPDLLAAVAELAAVKPVVAVVVGRNDVREFAASHTGALATGWRTTRAALRQAGAVLADDPEGAVAAATALAGWRARGGGIGLVTAQAGPGLVIADALATAGHVLPPLATASVARLRGLLPPITFLGNPVDTGRPGETMPAVLRTVAADPAVGMLGVYAITEQVVDLVGAVVEAGLSDVPVVLGVDGPAEEVAAVRRAARAAGVPLLRGPSRLAQGLAALAEPARVAAPAVAPPIAVGPGPWDEIRAKDLLAGLGVPSPARARCPDRAAAHAALAALGGPVAVKLVDATVLHKSDVGGVVLDVGTPEQLDDALDALEAAGAHEFLLERMAPGGVDLIAGARIDPVFGPIVLLGLGGTAAEALEDVAVRTAPITAEDAAAMVDDLAGARVLDGFRGGPVVDRAALGAVLAVLGGLVAGGDVADVEINPLRGTRTGLIALDAVVLGHDEVEEQS